MNYSKLLITFVGLLMLSACSNADSDTLAANAVKTGSNYQLDVYKSPTCGCCKDWVSYVEGEGFSATTHHPQNLNGVKDHYGVKQQYRSCHLAVTESGYVFEGHVPVRYMEQFLKEKPAGALGLAVPGMPLGSPGMAVDERFSRYQVLLLKADGSAEVYATVNSPADQ